MQVLGKIGLGLLVCFPTNVLFAWADFHAAMSSNAQYQKTCIEKARDWQLVYHLYTDHIEHGSMQSEVLRIPKIIHQIWLGSPFPEKYKALRDTWITNHPDWEYKLWTDQEIEEFGLENKVLYDAAKNYGAKSDIARYEILYRFGGLYVDTDFECLQPFDVLHHVCDFYAGLCTGKKVTFCNALIAARPGHPILEKCVRDLPKNMKVDGFNKTLQATGPFFFTSCYLACAGQNGSIDIAFPANYFYSWPNEKRMFNSRHEIEQWIRPESFAIHHWFVSWNGGKIS